MEKWLIWIVVLSSIFLPWIQLISGSFRKRHINYKHGIHKFDVTCKENKANQDHESDFYAFLKLSDATVSLAYNLIIFAMVAFRLCLSFLHLNFGRQLLKKIENTLNTYALTSRKKSKDFVGSFLQSFPRDFVVYGLDSIFREMLSEFRPTSDLPLMRHEWIRYETYKNYPTDGPSSPSKLAANGFYYTKQENKVKCFSCNITNDVWPENESVAETHQRISPECNLNLNVPISEQNDNLTAHRHKDMFPDFADKAKRLLSLNGLGSVSMNRLQLAVAGFYYSDVTHAVRCFSCGSRIKDLSVEDNPWFNHSSTCKHLQACVLSGEFFTKPSITTGLQQQSSIPTIQYPEYQDMKSRQASLKTFPIRNERLIKEIAVAGLFFTGKNDACRCFHSGCGLKGWTEDDDPVKEHATHFPHCNYINQLKRRNLKETLQRSREGATNRPSLPSDRIKFPEYREFQTRRTSFETFPRSNGIPALKLALAGLFFTGKGDICRCFSCGIDICKWEKGDDPYIDHLRFSPDCEYMKEIKDRYLITATQGSTQSDKVVCGSGQTGLISSNTQETVSENLDYSNCSALQLLIGRGYSESYVRDAFQKLQKIKGNEPVTAEDILDYIRDIEPNLVNAGNTENILPKPTMDLLHHNQETLETSSSRHDSRCKVCLDNEACILFLPCCHTAVCSTCDTTGAFRKCVICRAIVKESIRIYLS